MRSFILLAICFACVAVPAVLATPPDPAQQQFKFDRPEAIRRAYSLIGHTPSATCPAIPRHEANMLLEQLGFSHAGPSLLHVEVPGAAEGATFSSITLQAAGLSSANAASSMLAPGELPRKGGPNVGEA
jgi:hypothetical protein